LTTTASPGLGLVVRVHVFGGNLAALETSSSPEYFCDSRGRMTYNLAL
jgi:hypothetical protein